MERGITDVEGIKAKAFPVGRDAECGIDDDAGIKGRIKLIPTKGSLSINSGSRYTCTSDEEDEGSERGEDEDSPKDVVDDDDGVADGKGATVRVGDRSFVGATTPVLGRAEFADDGFLDEIPFFSPHKLEVMTLSMMRDTETEISCEEEEEEADEVDDEIFRLGR